MERIINWNLGSKMAVLTTEECEEAQTDKLHFRAYDEGRIELICRNKCYGEYRFEKGGKEFHHGDILSVDLSGNVKRIYDSWTGEVDFFLTNKCNSNCIMCPLSEHFRRKKQVGNKEWIKAFIEILPESVKYINVTGGEPTLIGQDFIDIMECLKRKFQHSDFQLLTNGRFAADVGFLNRIKPNLPRGIRFAIPVHASDSEVHDHITQAAGSFRQTDRGIRNLLNDRMKVEIRIVVSKLNIDSIEETARYIAQNYKGVFCVNFIAMEMTGAAAIHREEIWIDYDRIFDKIKRGINILVEHGIDVQLYNFPLCMMDKGYWPLAAKSITAHKVRYMDECENCKVKEICGGFFFSTKQLMAPKVFPVE